MARGLSKPRALPGFGFDLDHGRLALWRQQFMHGFFTFCNFAQMVAKDRGIF